MRLPTKVTKTEEALVLFVFIIHVFSDRYRAPLKKYDKMLFRLLALVDREVWPVFTAIKSERWVLPSIFLESRNFL